MEESLKTLNSRIFSNSVYFTFILSWILVHWRFFATLIFVSGEDILTKYSVSKDVYLKNILFDTSVPLISLIVLLAPFILTLLILYFVQPKLLPNLLKKHREYEIERIEIEKKGAIAEKKVIEIKKENIKESENLKTKESNLLNKSLEEFKKTKYFNSLDKLVECIFSFNGRINVDNSYGDSQFKLEKNLLAYLILNKLVKFSDSKNERIELTDMGNHIVSSYLKSSEQDKSVWTQIKH